MPKVKREKDGHWPIGAAKAFDDSGLLPLLHTLVEERVGERRLDWSVAVRGEVIPGFQKNLPKIGIRPLPIPPHLAGLEWKYCGAKQRSEYQFRSRMMYTTTPSQP
jgi:hypothetical protein